MYLSFKKRPFSVLINTTSPTIGAIKENIINIGCAIRKSLNSSVALVIGGNSIPNLRNMFAVSGKMYIT